MCQRSQLSYMRAGGLGFQRLEGKAGNPVEGPRLAASARICKGYMDAGNLLHRSNAVSASFPIAKPFQSTLSISPENRPASGTSLAHGR